VVRPDKGGGEREYHFEVLIAGRFNPASMYGFDFDLSCLSYHIFSAGGKKERKKHKRIKERRLFTSVPMFRGFKGNH
jgi:hypothetical protein